jgi:hypothetical protein
MSLADFSNGRQSLGAPLSRARISRFVVDFVRRAYFRRVDQSQKTSDR